MQQSKVSVKYSEENSVFGRVSYYLLLEFLWEGVGWGGRLFEAGRLLTFSAFRMGAYSRWALNRINTVIDQNPYIYMVMSQIHIIHFFNLPVQSIQYQF